MATFNYKGEEWVVKEQTETHVYAARPGKRGRPSKFTVQELTDAGVKLDVQPALPVVDQDAPVLDTNVDHDKPATEGVTEIELPF